MSRERDGWRPIQGRDAPAAIPPGLHELRCRIEALIDALIVFLDATDAAAEDREEEGDREPSLGAGKALPFSRPASVGGRRLVTHEDGLNQAHWGERPADPARLDCEWDVTDEGEADAPEDQPRADGSITRLRQRQRR